MTELYICAHRLMDPPWGPGIDFFSRLTNAKLSSKWVLKDGPSTHIFVVMKHADGTAWRHDAYVPVSVWTPDEKRGEEARWRLMLEPDAFAAAAHKARELTGTPYDLGEIALQAFTSITGLRPPPDLFSKALICSSLGAEVLNAADGDPRRFVEALPNYLPEMLAQRLRDCEGSQWLARVESL